MTSPACYILGLESNFRGNVLIKDLRAIGIDAQVHYGIDATKNQNHLAASIDQSASLFLQKREMGMSEVACALGHIQIWQKFMDQNLEWAFVFEDDAVVIEDVSKLLSSLTDIHEPTIIQLHQGAHDGSTIYRRQRIRVSSFADSGKEVHLLKKLHFSQGAYGYLINRQACHIALKAGMGRKITNVLDWPYLWRHKVAFWEPTSDLVKHQGMSIIDSDRAALIQALKKSPRQEITVGMRAVNFLSNVLGIPAWKFHKLGYPGRIVYFNNVYMPFRRRFLLLENRLSKSSRFRKFS